MNASTRFVFANKQFSRQLATTRTFSSTEAAAPSRAWIPVRFQTMSTEFIWVIDSPVSYTSRLFSLQKRYQSSELRVRNTAHPVLPIMGLVGFAAMCMPLYASTFYNGINVSVDEKNAVLPLSKEPATPSTALVKQAGAQPISFLGLGKRMHTVQREGLGVDHEEWKKAKEASKAEL